MQLGPDCRVDVGEVLNHFHALISSVGLHAVMLQDSLLLPGTSVTQSLMYDLCTVTVRSSICGSMLRSVVYKIGHFCSQTSTSAK